jgi:hypothetical protein
VPSLVQEYEIGLPDQRIFGAYVAARRCLGRVFLDEIEIFVADGDYAVVVPGIDHAAIFHPEGQIARQHEWAEDGLDPLEGTSLHEHVIQRLVGRVRRRHVVDLDAAGLCGS